MAAEWSKYYAGCISLSIDGEHVGNGWAPGKYAEHRTPGTADKWGFVVVRPYSQDKNGWLSIGWDSAEEMQRDVEQAFTGGNHG